MQLVAQLLRQKVDDPAVRDDLEWRTPRGPDHRVAVTGWGGDGGRQISKSARMLALEMRSEVVNVLVSVIPLSPMLGVEW